jgi:hypothetical protein
MPTQSPGGPGRAGHCVGLAAPALGLSPRRRVTESESAIRLPADLAVRVRVSPPLVAGLSRVPARGPAPGPGPAGPGGGRNSESA